ncbi:metallopeptidase family protein [Saxibacter everestensis]|uniref:Metallopeptidase family protein n=1 Tax=Saxibacter everestensis TaxID=2909229 RepID=A0ABY8QYU6_9MICO|nr:metallopeptidase family protein [Brevibacteriaceae bacterium ZFBP1038]
MRPPVPAARSRADRFDQLVLDAAHRLRRTWAEQMAGLQFAVETVPPVDPAPWEFGQVPLGRLYPGDDRQPPHIVVYRRPVETRAADPDDLAELVHDVVVEQVAALLGMEPEQIDPGYAGGS